jgi:transcription elongation factor
MNNLVNEELNKMKYLLGYQKGKVISEQDLVSSAEAPAATAEDVIKKIQTTLNTKYGTKLTVDGKWGNLTQTAFETATKSKSAAPAVTTGTAAPAATTGTATPAATTGTATPAATTGTATPAATTGTASQASPVSQAAPATTQSNRDQRRDRQDMRRDQRRDRQDLRSQQRSQ